MNKLTLIVAGLVLAGCHAAPDLDAYPGNESAGLSDIVDPYLPCAGDTLEIRFPAYPEWNEEVLIGPDGYAGLPLVGRTKIAGLQLTELEESIAVQLRARIRSPRIELSISNLRKRAVFVGGEVDYPGEVEIVGAGLTLAEAVFARGGPLWKTAALETVVLSRVASNGQRRAWTIDLQSTLLKGEADEAVRLQAGDVILLPANRVARANAFVEQYVTNMIPATGVLGLFFFQ